MLRWIKGFSILCLLPATLAAEGTVDLLAPTLALYVDFDGTPAQRSVQEMKREVAALLQPSGLRIEWRSLESSNVNDSFSDLYVLHFTGKCDMEGTRVLYSELGPYGETVMLGGARAVDRAVQPYGRIECDAVRRSVAKRLMSQKPEERESVFGRALGRVLAHEVYHMIAKTSTHAGNGVFKSSYSSQDLICDHFDFDKAERRELTRIADRMIGRSAK